METINIKIKTKGYNTLEATSGCLSLFYFEYRDWEYKWYFWPNTDFNPTVFDGAKFPKDYFENLCKAIKIIAGKKYLKVAPSLA